ncbi:OmpA family protein [Pinibacter soli]|uniref:OmpA family protein n=1 Tax=Pinibacter soli TaxID=3044211 RepID=A0ABT6RFQ6_9BACT|nr:OmpA family protein [Pinibacter soli]MDI3321393.1 OmpA family protein [Pinibacter soli]
MFTVLEKNKRITLFVAVCFCFCNVFTQTGNSPTNFYKRNPLLGIHFNASNYSRPLNLSQTNTGYFFSFIDGIAGKYDYMIQAGSTSPKFAFSKNASNKDLLHFISVNGIRRFFSDSVSFNPFINAGPGIGVTASKTNFFFNAGAGFEIRFTSKIFLHTQFNYQINTSSQVDNNTSVSIGLLGTIFQRKRKPVANTAERSVSTIQKTNDQHHDGIIDINDSCSTIAGPKSFTRFPDSDGDGIPDYKDNCPTIPGLARLNGCPLPVSRPPQLVIVDTSNIPATSYIGDVINNLAKEIHFNSDKATLMPLSAQILDTIARLLTTQQYKQLTIEGYTDNTGTTKRNRELSKERAVVVLEYLASKGIDRTKMQAIGLGDAHAIANNDTPEGRSQNRRTVFVLVK